MQEFYMTDAEIAGNFRNAKRKSEQIGILADLNAVDKRVMQNKLIELGLIDSEIVPDKSVGGRPRTVSIDGDRVRQLYKQGKTDKEIAADIGVGVTTITSWRRNNGLYRYGESKTKKRTSIKQQAEKLAEARMQEITEQLKEQEMKKELKTAEAPPAAPTACQPAKPVDVWQDDAKPAAEETPVKVAENAAGLSAAELGELFANTMKMSENTVVTVNGKPVTSAVIMIEYRAGCGNAPVNMAMNLRT